MSTTDTSLSSRAHVLASGWGRFWFAPTDPATLCLIRILTGWMLFYTHLIWSLDLQTFFAPDGIFNHQAISGLKGAGSWSYFWWIESAGLRWSVHIVALILFALLTVGLFTRVVAPLAFLVAVSYANCVTPGVYFGLDKINCLLALYLVLGPCGARYSLDRWLARRRHNDEVVASSAATTAIRLIQMHLCLVYFFSGLTKLMGQSWWDGTAVWWSVSNLEYQSLDLTWLASWPILMAFMSFGTALWELVYPALIWPRLTRPAMLWIAVAVHGGIAVALGMITFGYIMIVANLAFVAPETVRWLLRDSDRQRR